MMVLEAVMASGGDRHLDIGLQVVETHPLFPYFLEKRLPFLHLLFSNTSKWFFCYIYIIYVYNVCGPKNIESLTFSNFRGRTSRRIYRLALPLLPPETLSLLRS